MKKNIFRILTVAICISQFLFFTSCNQRPKEGIQFILKVDLDKSENRHVVFEKTYSTIVKRLDGLSDFQFEIETEETKGLIKVKVYGRTNFQQLRNYFTSSGKLEFYETYRLSELAAYFKAADASLFPKAKPKVFSASDTLNDQQSLLDIMWANMQALGNNAPNGCVVALVDKKDTLRLNALLRKPEAKAELPKELILRWSARAIGSSAYQLYALRSTGTIGKEAVLDGNVISDAKLEKASGTDFYQIQIHMNAEGTAKWYDITQNNIRRNIAMSFDDKIFCAPNVENKITGGISVISGNFTKEEADRVVKLIQAGVLPVAVKIVNESVILPSLN